MQAAIALPQSAVRTGCHVVCAALQAWLARLERLQLAGNAALAETLAPTFGVVLTSVPSVRL